MQKGKRIICFLLVGMLVLGMGTQAKADTIDEKKQQGEQLEAEKSAAESEQSELSSQLNVIIADMKKTEEDLTTKRLEIQVAEEELDAAKIQENEQYSAMKLRIKYLYENGNEGYIEILCESKDLTDLINKAEYVSTVSQYDRDLLTEFQETVKQVEEKEAALKEEETKLQELQTQLIAQQGEVEVLLANKNIQIANLEAAIGKNAQELQGLIAQAQEAAKRQQEAASSSSHSSSSAGGSVVSGSGVLSHPCPGYSRISSTFGPRKAPTAGASTFHGGIDFAASTGTPIYAAQAGTVTTSVYSSSAGNYVVINHGNGMQTVYMHMNARYVAEGQQVAKGQNIGAVGSTGVSTGPHLHFEVKVNGSKVNPASYL